MVGIDEVGRGCLAGPLLVVAAKQIKPLPAGLADSKILTRGQRGELFISLIGNCEFGEGWVSPTEIDKYGLAGALRLGVKRALGQIKVIYDERIIMDGPINYAPRYFSKVQCLIGADALIPLVSAASVYAKVKRDEVMRKLTKIYPRYGFENHVGYGTPSHLRALKTYGPIPKVHRMSFSLLKAIEQRT